MSSFDTANEAVLGLANKYFYGEEVLYTELVDVAAKLEIWLRDVWTTIASYRQPLDLTDTETYPHLNKLLSDPAKKAVGRAGELFSWLTAIVAYIRELFNKKDLK